MSETVSAPAPAAAPTAQPATPGVTPGTLSLREAASLLGRRRHEAARNGHGGAPDGAQAPAATQGAPNGQEAPSAAPGAATEGAPAESTRPDGKPDPLAAAFDQQGQGQGEAPAAPEGTPTSYQINGRTYEAAEVQKALSLAGDYTQKTQALAAQQKQVVEHAQQLQRLAEQHKAFETVLPLLQPELNRLASSFQLAPQPDMALLETDPQGYLRQLAQHQASQAELARLQQIMGVQTEAQQRHLAQSVDRANAVLSEKYAVWRDPAQREVLQNQIVEWATTKGGFSRDELKNLSDHRHLETMMKAAMYDRLSEGAKTRPPQQMAPATGQRPPPPRPAALREAEARFDAKTDWRNGAALLTARRALGR